MRYPQLLILLFSTLAVSSSPQAPTYKPHRIRPIPWPSDSPSPQSHASDFAQAFIALSGESIGIQRSPVAWGTGVVDEWYFVFRPPAKDKSGADSLWAAPSFYDECGPCARGEPQHAWITVGACMFVADDSLLGYAVVHDSSSVSRRFADSTNMRSRNGYYRVGGDPSRLVKVAEMDTTALMGCRAQLAREGRNVAHR